MTSRALLDALAKERDELRRLIYVPGLHKCAKCGCVTISTAINAETGQFRADNQPQACPNGCGPMWPVTERQAGNEMADRCEQAERERDEAKGE